MKNFFNKMGMGLSLAIAGIVGYAGFAHAAADTDLASSTELITEAISDNKVTILTFAVGIVVFALIMGGAFKLFGWGKRQILGTIPGGGKRRR